LGAISARHYCRNPRCRSKLSAPVPHRRDAFCTKGCHSSFYLRRCLVCERELPTGRRSDAKLCRMPKCRSSYRRNPAIFEFRGLGTGTANLGSKTPDFIDPKPPLKPDRPWHIVAGPKLSASAFHCATVGAEQERRRRSSNAIFQRHVPPLNVLGGYRFPDAPAIDLTAPKERP